MKKIVFVLSFLLLSCFSYSQTIPESKGYVSDYENIFTPEQNVELTKLLTDYEKETSIEIVVLTVKDFESDIADFSQKTAEKWGIGKKDIDNGLLIVISKNKKVLRSETGYGLEGYLPDGWLKLAGDSVVNKYITDSIKKDQYYAAVVEFVNKCKNRIGREYSKDTNKSLIKKSESKDKESVIGWLIRVVPWWGWLLIIGIWLIIFFIDPGLAIQILFLGFAGKGGGGGGFGGGSFGGGGSSSRW